MSELRLPKAVLFDLDGTLVDSAPDLLAAMNRLRGEHDLAPLALSELRPVVSKGGRAMLAVAFPHLAADAREPLLPPFLAYYAEALAVHSVAFDGVPELLDAIEARGLRWGIVTNKPMYLARDVVAGFGWQQRSAVLLGGDSLPRRKPDPDQLLQACVELGVQPSECLYVGDDERDAIAARAAGMRMIVALWGYRSAEEDPAQWGGDVLAASARDLVDVRLLALP
ncbi:MAG TPA: phosphoglycolate phosphatase [Arenimonas sp.]|nr:phosphoglycolate phosphatase [Arenimonas sp.]